jgi:starvation-inducible DNA-binding protein
MTTFTVPGLDDDQSTRLADALQQRLTACNDLHLTLKHVHWNVVGPSFIAVHEMLDPQVELVRGYADEIAERIATLGGSPDGRPGANVAQRTWDDYSLGRDTVTAHLAALDLVYDGVIGDHRKAIAIAAELDPVTEDLLIGQTAELEKFQWFVRAHLEDKGGRLPTEGAGSEKAAAAAAR